MIKTYRNESLTGGLHSLLNINDFDYPKIVLFDGNGGSACADYLRDNLYLLIVKNHAFPKDPEAAIRNGFANVE